MYVAMADDVPGPGSLNRFMRQGVFKRAQEDPSAARPPRFVKVGSFPTSLGESSSSGASLGGVFAEKAVVELMYFTIFTLRVLRCSRGTALVHRLNLTEH